MEKPLPRQLLRILRNTTLTQSPSWSMTPLIAGLPLSELATQLRKLWDSDLRMEPRKSPRNPRTQSI
jgi:hypothetical protein